MKFKNGMNKKTIEIEVEAVKIIGKIKGIKESEIGRASCRERV